MEEFEKYQKILKIHKIIEMKVDISEHDVEEVIDYLKAFDSLK
jgi:hypothetical protein